MQTTGIITQSVYRTFVEFRVKRKKGTFKAQTLTGETVTRLVYIIVLFPLAFFLVSHFVFKMGLTAAAGIAVLWFISFILAGLLYHRAIVSLVTARPSSPEIDKPRDYEIEGDWLVVRTAETENRVSLKRAVDLIVTPTVSFLDCGDHVPVLLPFGSASEDATQRAFLDALKGQLPKSQTT